MRVLITGSCGQVGSALLATAPPHVRVHALSRAELDIGNSDEVHATVAGIRPSVIINAAAYTAVDKAESEPGPAETVNALGPRNLAQAALAVPGCRLLHISTDYVFDGKGSGAYKPSDATNPVSVYGRTKLRGERAVLEVLAERATILRTAWVYAPRGKNFLLTMLRLMRDRPSVRVVADQHGTPTTADSIASALWALADRPDIHGITHWTDGGRATWHEFAEAIAEHGRAAGLLPAAVQVLPISTAEYPTPAVRPANSVLECGELIARLKVTPVPWRANLRATLAQVQ